MAFQDGEMKAFSVLGTAVLTIALFVPVLYLTKGTTVEKSKWDDMESIEASVAYKKTPVKQPTKPTSQPDVKKPEGVSHDDKKPANVCKADADCHADEKCKDGKCIEKEAKVVATADPKDPFAGHHRDDDNETGKPKLEQIGDFNGSEFGWASETKGAPFFQKLAQDFRQDWTIPSITQVNGTPVGCFHINPDGKIPDIKFKEKSGDAILDDSVERRLEAVQKLRNDNPVKVPDELLGATSRWICFRFDPKTA